jgi:TIR domain
MSARVFVSYSHADEALRDQLEVQLAMLKRQGLIDVWHDRRLIAGDRLDWSIETKLDEAEIILLLLSPDFLASDYCYNIEKGRALARHRKGEARLISVILRPCDWMHTDLREYLVTPKDGKPVTQWPDRDVAFLDVVQSIRTALQEIGKTRTTAMPQVSTATSAPAPLPRSSNLRLKRAFTQADKDTFLLDAFDFVGRFFEGSLEELAKRHLGVEGRFRKIDANTFTAVVYQKGNKVASCTVRLGGAFGRGIAYSNGDDADRNGMNEQLSVEADDQALFLKAMGMQITHGPGREAKLSFEGAAEYYWALLLDRLQGK